MKQVNLIFIQERRQEQAITLQEMAVKLGFKNASNYLKYEKGEYVFKAFHMPLLAKALHCSLDDLFLENILLK